MFHDADAAHVLHARFPAQGQRREKAVNLTRTEGADDTPCYSSQVFAIVVFVRRFILPMFTNLGYVHVVYSKRLLNAQSSDTIFGGSPSKIVSDVIGTLQTTGLLGELTQCYSAEKFLVEHGSQLRDSGALAYALTRVHLFDLTAAAALVGDQFLTGLYLQACKEHLQSITIKLPVDDPFPSDVHALSSALETDRASAVGLLERNAAANAVRLGFHLRPLDVAGKR